MFEGKALRDASKKRRLLRLRRCLSLAFAFLPPPFFFLGFAFLTDGKKRRRRRMEDEGGEGPSTPPEEKVEVEEE